MEKKNVECGMQESTALNPCEPCMMQHACQCAWPSASNTRHQQYSTCTAPAELSSQCQACLLTHTLPARHLLAHSHHHLGCCPAAHKLSQLQQSKVPAALSSMHCSCGSFSGSSSSRGVLHMKPPRLMESFSCRVHRLDWCCHSSSASGYVCRSQYVEGLLWHAVVRSSDPSCGATQKECTQLSTTASYRRVMTLHGMYMR
jgi:hypothetical protein